MSDIVVAASGRTPVATGAKSSQPGPGAAAAFRVGYDLDEAPDLGPWSRLPSEIRRPAEQYFDGEEFASMADEPATFLKAVGTHEQRRAGWWASHSRIVRVSAVRRLVPVGPSTPTSPKRFRPESGWQTRIDVWDLNAELDSNCWPAPRRETGSGGQVRQVSGPVDVWAALPPSVADRVKVLASEGGWSGIFGNHRKITETMQALGIVDGRRAVVLRAVREAKAQEDLPFAPWVTLVLDGQITRVPVTNPSAQIGPVAGSAPLPRGRK